MKNLIQRLQAEAELTEDQALRTIDVFISYLDEEGVKVNWKKLLTEKEDNLSEKAKSFFDSCKSLVKHTQDYTEKLADKIDDLAVKTKKNTQDFNKKAHDFFEKED